MSKKKAVTTISAIVGLLLVCLVWRMRRKDESLPVPLAVKIYSEAGKMLALYELPLKSPQLRDVKVLGKRVALGTGQKFKSLLLKNDNGTWISEVARATVTSTNGLLRFAIPKPTNSLWKIRVIISEHNDWRFGNGSGLGSLFEKGSQTFESEVFTN